MASSSGDIDDSSVIEEAMEDTQSGDVIEGSWFVNNQHVSASPMNSGVSVQHCKRPLQHSDGSIDSLPDLDLKKAKRSKTYQSINAPTNKTMNSIAKLTVVIKQVDSQKRITLDPIGVARGMKHFGFSNVKDVRINRRQNVIAVEFNEDSSAASEISNLLNAKKMDKYSIECYQPNATGGSSCIGVIGPINLDIDLDELKTMCKSESTILNMTRLPKFSNGKKEVSHDKGRI